MLFLLVSVLAVCAPLACGAGKTANEDLTPEDVLAAAARTADIHTYRASFKGSAEAAGQTVEMDGEGEFAAKGKRGRVSMTSSVLGMEIKVDMVTVWPLMYMRFPAAADSRLPPGKEWIKYDLQKLGKELGVDFTELMQASRSDPSHALAYLQKVADLETVGAEEVRGTETTHFRGVVDMRSVADAYPELKDSVDAVIRQSGIDRMPVDVWVSADGLVRRMTMRYQDMRSLGSPSTDMTMEMELYDFGAAVTIEEPPADAVISFQELMRLGNAA